jgi:hypothetical protein
MWKHLQSATKLVLLSMTAALIVSIFVHSLNDSAFELFKNAYIAIIAFYFGKGQTPSPGSVTVTPADDVSKMNTSVSTQSDPE